MKKILAILAMVPLMALAKTSTPEGFTDNLDEAFAAAKASGKYVYACFSGSDWCGWCKKLDKEVFAHAAFLDGVTNDYVLVFIDNPNNPAVLSEHAKKENRNLTKKYGIRGFPSALILSAEGDQIAQMGYKAGGPAPYVSELMDIRKNGPELKKRAAAAEAFLAPFKTRAQEMKDTLYKECEEAMKAPTAKAKATLEAIIRDIEAAQVAEGVSQKRDEYLKELNGLKKMLKE